MLSTGKLSNPSYILDFDYTVQHEASRVAVHNTFHMRRLEFPALHDDLARGEDGALSYIKEVVVVFRKAKYHSHLRFSCGGADLVHFF